MMMKPGLLGGLLHYEEHGLDQQDLAEHTIVFNQWFRPIFLLDA